ncbi:unnamed protein product [Amoebophrya sp. A120]|nr:unnamed protein product [Amoebophrya sp. A120]|eukprot:GSA120T00001812001.1
MSNKRPRSEDESINSLAELILDRNYRVLSIGGGNLSYEADLGLSRAEKVLDDKPPAPAGTVNSVLPTVPRWLDATVLQTKEEFLKRFNPRENGACHMETIHLSGQRVLFGVDGLSGLKENLKMQPGSLVAETRKRGRNGPYDLIMLNNLYPPEFSPGDDPKKWATKRFPDFFAEATDLLTHKGMIAISLEETHFHSANLKAIAKKFDFHLVAHFPLKRAGLYQESFGDVRATTKSADFLTVNNVVSYVFQSDAGSRVLAQWLDLNPSTKRRRLDWATAVDHTYLKTGAWSSSGLRVLVDLYTKLQQPDSIRKKVLQEFRDAYLVRQRQYEYLDVLRLSQDECQKIFEVLVNDDSWFYQWDANSGGRRGFPVTLNARRSAFQFEVARLERRNERVGRQSWCGRRRQWNNAVQTENIIYAKTEEFGLWFRGKESSSVDGLVGNDFKLVSTADVPAEFRRRIRR